MSAPAEPLRIALMVTGLNRGGAETQVSRIALGLHERGHEVEVISLIPPVAFVEELEAAGITVCSLDIPAGRIDPRLLTRALATLRRFRPDVLLSFMFHANLLARLAGKLARVPVILGSVRGERFGLGRWRPGLAGVRLRELLIRWSDRLGDGMTTMSRAVAALLVQRRIVPAHRLRLIPNLIDLERLESGAEDREELRRQLGLEGEGFLWLNVARLTPIKDQVTLLRAFHLLLRDHPEAYLAIAGGGELLEPLEQLTAELGLDNAVHFLGERSDVSALHAAVDAAVLSSLSEGLPNALIEAHAARLPVVATAVGGVGEVVTEGSSGYLVPAGDEHALANAMKRLMELSPEERAAFGKAGREHVRVTFGRNAVLDAWQTLFRETRSAKR